MKTKKLIIEIDLKETETGVEMETNVTTIGLKLYEVLGLLAHIENQIYKKIDANCVDSESINTAGVKTE